MVLFYFKEIIIFWKLSILHFWGCFQKSQFKENFQHFSRKVFEDSFRDAWKRQKKFARVGTRSARGEKRSKKGQFWPQIFRVFPPYNFFETHTLGHPWLVLQYRKIKKWFIFILRKYWFFEICQLSESHYFPKMKMNTFFIVLYWRAPYQWLWVWVSKKLYGGNTQKIWGKNNPFWTYFLPLTDRVLTRAIYFWLFQAFLREF